MRVESTPDRTRVWTVQTPQVFSYRLILEAHEAMRKKGMEGVTDDAMVVEAEGKCNVVMVEGSYENMKITTPVDLIIAESILSRNTSF
jgi:2-C-methyl-D-erythritol 4-phosphate cytidylyltransferase